MPQRELRPGRQLSPASDCLGRVWVEPCVFFPSQVVIQAWNRCVNLKLEGKERWHKTCVRLGGPGSSSPKMPVFLRARAALTSSSPAARGSVWRLQRLSPSTGQKAEVKGRVCVWEQSDS